MRPYRHYKFKLLTLTMVNILNSSSAKNGKEDKSHLVPFYSNGQPFNFFVMEYWKLPTENFIILEPQNSLVDRIYVLRPWNLVMLGQVEIALPIFRYSLGSLTRLPDLLLSSLAQKTEPINITHKSSLRNLNIVCVLKKDNQQLKTDLVVKRSHERDWFFHLPVFLEKQS